EFRRVLFRSSWLFLHAQRFNRIQPGRPPRRIDSEEKPHHARKPHSQKHGRPGNAMGTAVTLRTSTASIQAIATPAKPPVAAKHEDSTRNWFRMSRRRAPSD